MTRVETGNYTHMKELPGQLYYFYCIPSYIGYANSGSNPTVIYNADGTLYQGGIWTLEDNALYYDGNIATYAPSENISIQLYAWVYDDGENIHVVYTEAAPSADGQTITEPWAPLYNSDYTPYTGSDFYVSQDLVTFRNNPASYDSSLDPEQLHLYAWKYIAPKVSIYGNSPSNPTAFYNYDAEKTLYIGTDWTVKNGEVYYIGTLATRDPEKDTSTAYPNLTSYIIDASGKEAQPINAEVGIVSIVKDKLIEEKVRALSLLLCATMGINPYLSGD
jgi:hypothetical protein